jgi:Flp pilus assembly pilin Flp
LREDVIGSLKQTLVRAVFKGKENGQTLVEYGLIVSLIAVAAIFGVTLVAGGVDALWTWIGGDVGNAVDSVLN